MQGKTQEHGRTIIIKAFLRQITFEIIFECTSDHGIFFFNMQHKCTLLSFFKATLLDFFLVFTHQLS